MKYLKDYFENNFEVTTADGVSVRNGVKFEDFVKEILYCEFPKNMNFTVEATQTTHDGGKDFVITSDNLEIWAECKNYKKPLSLSNIANTLVFAHIKNINEVLIFSYSKLNPNALDTISSFFKYDNKIVRIYDDEALENLILFHYEKLSKKFLDLPKLEGAQINEIDHINVQI
ncbi:MAG: restriction endonuclease, partial [Clostridia bacterium]|nr:restriction endonuclease [Clostridia bacterium]